MMFIFSEFDTLLNYISTQLKIVQYIRNEADRHRSDCLEDVFTLLSEAITLDYGFLLSKDESVFLAFLQLLDNFYSNSFSIKLRLELLSILSSIMI